MIKPISPTKAFKVEKLFSDGQGRFIILKVSLDEKIFVLANIYAPNDVVQQATFFKKLSKQLEEFAQDTIVIGGDFNCALTSSDKKGGISISKNRLLSKKSKRSVICIS